MKTTWDELMRYAPEQEIPLPPMQDGECARILNKTMGKIKETKQKPARPVRTVLIAAAIAALLCGRVVNTLGKAGFKAHQPQYDYTFPEWKLNSEYVTIRKKRLLIKAGVPP